MTRARNEPIPGQDNDRCPLHTNCTTRPLTGAIRETRRARSPSSKRRTEQAIAHAKKVVELEPDDAFSYTALSVIYQRCGRIPEAEHAKAMAFQKQMGFE
jgi:Flp pilus assembly protein TadD